MQRLTSFKLVCAVIGLTFSGVSYSLTEIDNEGGSGGGPNIRYITLATVTVVGSYLPALEAPQGVPMIVPLGQGIFGPTIRSELAFDIYLAKVEAIQAALRDKVTTPDMRCNLNVSLSGSTVTSQSEQELRGQLASAYVKQMMANAATKAGFGKVVSGSQVRLDADGIPRAAIAFTWSDGGTEKWMYIPGSLMAPSGVVANQPLDTRVSDGIKKPCPD